MTSAILGTPVWVWLVLAYTVWVGLRATKPRALTPAAIVVLPAVLLLVSAWPLVANATALVPALA